MTKSISQYFCYNCLNSLPSATHHCPYCGFDRSTFQQPQNALPPETLLQGRYLLGKTIGIGGFGITYLGLDLQTMQRIAVKEYFPAQIARREMTGPGRYVVKPVSENKKLFFKSGINRYLREGEYLALFFENPNIVQVRGYFLENNTAYLVMEYIEGVSLRRFLKQRGGKMGAEEAVSFLMPILSALLCMHDKRLIHRDISPDNIMVTPKGSLVLIDFGEAVQYDRFSGSSYAVLKPGYAPPEQYLKYGKQGPWTDEYAFCAILYRTITGKVPVESRRRQEGEYLPPPSQYGVAIHPNLERILMKGLDTEPEKRYSDLHVLYREICRYAQGRQAGFPTEEYIRKQPKEESMSENAFEQKNHKKRTVLAAGGAALALTALIGIAGVFIINGKNQRRHLENMVSSIQGNLRVPNLEGMAEERAAAELAGMGLSMEVVEVNYSDSIPKGEITAQIPESGEKIADGGTVQVKRSGGTEEVMLPELTGQSRENAEEWLKSQNMQKLVTWSDDVEDDSLYSDKQEEGIILSQKPEAGQLVALISGKLELSVCHGNLYEKTDELEVPDLRGLLPEDAKKEILANTKGEQGYTFSLADGENEISEEFSWDYMPGAITKQSPAAGETVRTNKKIHITVARELQETTIPDIVGKSLEEAKAALEEAHIKCKTAGAYSDSVAVGRVMGITYESGKAAVVGETMMEKDMLTVVYSLGSRPAPQPAPQQAPDGFRPEGSVL